MYIETGRQNPGATISAKTGASAVFSRSWKIKVTMIECDNPSRYYYYWVAIGAFSILFQGSDGLCAVLPHFQRAG